MDTCESGEIINSPTVTKIIPALIKAQQAFLPAYKESKNPHYNSRYCDLAGCVDACKTALAEHGMTVIQVTITTPVAKLVTTLFHESGEWIRSFYPLTPQKMDPQGMGSAVTYARRYALMAIVGLAPEDDDGTQASQRPANNQQQRPQQQNGHAGSGLEEVIGPLPPMKRGSEIPQPPPRQQPTREPDGQVPTSGRFFWGWTGDMEKKYEYPFREKIKPWAKKLNWNWDSREWSDEQVATAVKFVQDLVRRIDDQSGGEEPENQSQEPPQADGATKGPLQISKQDYLGPLKAAIASTARQLCFARTQRPATEQEIMARIDEIAADVFNGECIGNLRDYKDGGKLVAVRDAAKAEQEACRAFGGAA